MAEEHAATPSLEQLKAEVTRLSALVVEQSAIIKQQAERIAELEARLAKDSHPPCQDRCVCRSTAASVGKEPSGQHEKLPKRWRDRPAGVCLQGPAPNRP